MKIYLQLYIRFWCNHFNCVQYFERKYNWYRTTHTLGTIEIAGNVIRSTDSTQIEVNDSLKVIVLYLGGVTTISTAGSNNIESSTGFTLFSSIVLVCQSLAFEGATVKRF